MPRIIPVFLLLCIIAFIPPALAQGNKQSYTIKGSVIDTLNNARLQNAAITLLRARDSILVTFTRADASGSFTLHPDTPGRYVMLVTYPGFADYIDGVQVKDASPIILGDVPMVSRTHLLQEFVLKKKSAAILVKGDTTEYNADSFTVRNGATVDELLKKLPGHGGFVHSVAFSPDGHLLASGSSDETGRLWGVKK